MVAAGRVSAARQPAAGGASRPQPAPPQESVSASDVPPCFCEAEEVFPRGFVKLYALLFRGVGVWLECVLFAGAKVRGGSGVQEGISRGACGGGAIQSRTAS